jgi:hypothetical protein
LDGIAQAIGGYLGRMPLLPVSVCHFDNLRYAQIQATNATTNKDIATAAIKIPLPVPSVVMVDSSGPNDSSVR